MTLEVLANSSTPGTVVPLTTLAAAITTAPAAGTSEVWTTNAAAPASLQVVTGQFRIVIDSEIMVVTAGMSGTSWTMTRGAEGSTPATHVIGSSIYHYVTAGALNSYVMQGGAPGGIFNVMSPIYGAKGDGKTVADGAITTGTATLTSATAAFTAADVGKSIGVQGASALALTANTHTSTTVDALAATNYMYPGMSVTGSGVPAATTVATIVNSTTITISAATTTTLTGTSLTFGATLYTTISGFTNATTVTLAANASVTVSAKQVTYGTLDTTALQAAYNDAGSGGAGVVYFPPGHMFLTGDLTIPGSNIVTLGGGWDSVIYQWFASGDNHYMLSVNPGSGGTTDPTQNTTGIEVRDIKLRGSCDVDGFYEHIYLLNVNATTDLRVHDCFFQGFRGDAIYVGSGNTGGIERHNQAIKIRDNRFDGINGMNRQGISFIDADDALVDGNTFLNNGRADMPGAIDFEPNAAAYSVIRDVRVIDNWFKNISGNAGVISLLQTTAQASLTTPTTAITIARNQFLNCASNSGGCIFMQQSQTPTVATFPNDITIIDNTIDTVWEPWELSGLRGVEISANQIRNAAGSAHHGYTNVVMDVRIIDNAFRNIGTTTGACLSIENATRFTVRGNLFDNIGLANGTDGRVLNLTLGNTTNTSDTIEFVNNEIIGTLATTLLQKNASHTIASINRNRCFGNRLNGLAVSSSFWNVVENSGTATVANGTTSIAVTHGLAITPAAQDITLVLTNATTNAVGQPWITAIGATTFTINCANPGVSTAIWGWSVGDNKLLNA